jgi:hypothetical protein
VQPNTPQNHTDIQAIELVMSRAHMNDTEFEQYKLEGSTLFGECGSIRRGRFMPQAHQVKEISATELAAVHHLVEGVEPDLGSSSLDNPGDNSWMADPGQFILSVRAKSAEQKIKTSLDSVSTPTTKRERALNQLATQLRSLTGEALCGNKSFYGLNSVSVAGRQ